VRTTRDGCTQVFFVLLPTCKMGGKACVFVSVCVPSLNFSLNENKVFKASAYLFFLD
jgi:hypothetical protein